MAYRACVNCFLPLSGNAVCPRCGFDNAAYRPQPHQLRPGAVLRGHYVVGRALGQGGFGITYAGCDPSLNRRVAIKEYFPEGTAIRETARTARVSCYASESFQERYHAGLRKCLNEARALAQLDDIPGIVRVLEYFQENNTAYIIMEFVEGVTLNAYLKQLPEKPSYREALALLAPVGRALEEIHARGFVHRDVSPDNIMIDKGGRPVLLDFGAVKTVSEGGSATESPVIKRGFSPIEMYFTDGKIGPWSDVYAYCATLYYIITGRRMEEPKQPERGAEEAFIASLSKVASPAQTAALRKGLVYDPGRRYRSVAEMTAALTACRDDLPGTAQIETAAAATERVNASARQPERFHATVEKTEPVRPSKRKYIVSALAVAALAALCTVIAVFAGRSSGDVSVKATTAAPASEEPSDKVSVDATTAASGNDIVTQLASANVGDYVTFGAYEQDNNTANGKESIEWLVLTKEDGKALLLSREALDCQPYNKSYDDVTWETCFLRTWLNGTFLTGAFSSGEQGMIQNSVVTADQNPSRETSAGNDTTDKLFLLSIPEADEYFSTDKAMECRPTDYAKKQGAWTGDNGCCHWWLRSPGHYPNDAAYVRHFGYIDDYGSRADQAEIAVRPALWVELPA